MKNTLKLIVAASIVAVAASCGAKTESSSENADTVSIEAPVPAAVDTTEVEVPADTTSTEVAQ